MKCPECDGYKNFISLAGTPFEVVKPCKRCNGTGKVEQNNEEWFCSLSTKEKAKWLENKMTWAAQEQGTFTAKGWEMWLKQPHREE